MSLETAIVKKSYSATDKGRQFRVMAGNEFKKEIEAERERNRKIGKKANVVKFAKPVFVNLWRQGNLIVVQVFMEVNGIRVPAGWLEIKKDELEAGEPKAGPPAQADGRGVKRLEGNNPVADRFVDRAAEIVKRTIDSSR